MNAGDDLSSFSMVELFRAETETQRAVLTEGLLHLERAPGDPGRLEALMRAAHSLKGAARIVEIDAAVRVAHVMEDLFVAAQKGDLMIQQKEIDLMLGGVDLLGRIANTPESEMPEWSAESGEVTRFVVAAEMLRGSEQAPAIAIAARLPVSTPNVPVMIQPAVSVAAAPEVALVSIGEPTERHPLSAGADADVSGRYLRITATNLNRLLALAGEALVDSRRLRPFADKMQRTKRKCAELSDHLDKLRDALHNQASSQELEKLLMNAQAQLGACRESFSSRLDELETLDRRSVNLSQRLYSEALACRMRPFADGVQGFPRMVRDVSRTLRKQAALRVIGEATQVDRDILEKIEAPITHLLRNAIDHGIESPEERVRSGKSAEGTIVLEARHGAGALLITVSDDGRGIDVEKLRRVVVDRKLTTAAAASNMSEAELQEFMFLPGFTMKESVTEISGRGVGLDVVQSTIRSVRGSLRVVSELGRGAKFFLHLPLTVSVVRALIVEIAGEPYALPLAHIAATIRVERPRITTIEGRQHFVFQGEQVGLVSARQVLERGESTVQGDDVPVVVLGDRGRRYGVTVDRLIGEQGLVVQTLDPRLKKIRNISAGAVMEDGAPLLIVDVEDLIVSIEKLISTGQLRTLRLEDSAASIRKRKRVLVVDDSLTVRELQRKLLRARGYDVDLAVDGMDGWNAVRSAQYDLVISDIDMPRLDGIELVSLIRKDNRLRSMPVMIVSYKDREEDRQRGFEAGADHYLTKGSFHDDSLISAVRDLIGEAEG